MLQLYTGKRKKAPAPELPPAPNTATHAAIIDLDGDPAIIKLTNENEASGHDVTGYLCRGTCNGKWSQTDILLRFSINEVKENFNMERGEKLPKQIKDIIFQ